MSSRARARLAHLGIPAALLIASIGSMPAALLGQDSARPPVELRNVISANPFLLIATWFNVEYEHMISETSTVGGRLSTVSFGTDTNEAGGDETNYFSGRGFWRYYPNGAYGGFFFGLDLGITSLKEEQSDSHTVIGAGFELGYNWLLGTRRNFYISIGAGADRLFAGDLGDASAVIPTVRIVNIGFAF